MLGLFSLFFVAFSFCFVIERSVTAVADTHPLVGVTSTYSPLALFSSLPLVVGVSATPTPSAFHFSLFLLHTHTHSLSLLSLSPVERQFVITCIS